jgi:RNA polymerase sigma-70 factor (ECF subfamily)
MDELKEQFGKIYDEYIEKIYRFVYLKVNSREIAEDISSKVFMRGWDSYRAKGESIKNIGAFLYQVSRNMVIDHYRQKGRTNMVSTEYVTEIVDNGAGIHEKAIINADIEIVKSALKNIKKDYQDVIIWHYLEDMPASEISQIIDKPEGTVRVMIHRGLEALKGELNQEA